MFGTISEAVFNQKNADKLPGVFGVFPFSGFTPLMPGFVNVIEQIRAFQRENRRLCVLNNAGLDNCPGISF